MTSSDYAAGVTWAGPPRSYTTGRKTPVRLSVIHTTEGHAGADAAEVGPVIDKNRTDGTSTHCFHDNNSSTQEVLRKDTAHAAFFHGNTLGIQHENCGTATWTAAQWQGDYQQAMLRRCAAAVADDCRTYGLEPRRLSVAEVRRAYYGPAPYPKGICGHADITAAFPEDGGTHWDPGPNFPWTQFIGMVKEFLSGAGDDMTPAQAQQLTDVVAVVDAMVNMRPNFAPAVFGGQPVILSNFLTDLRAEVDAIKATVDALTVVGADHQHPGGVTGPAQPLDPTP